MDLFTFSLSDIHLNSYLQRNDIYLGLYNMDISSSQFKTLGDINLT